MKPLHLLFCYLAMGVNFLYGQGTWIQKANFGAGVRYSAVGFGIGAKGYMGTGYNAGVSFKDFWEYDPSTDIWTQKADFGGTGRYGAAAFAIGSKGYIGTGGYPAFTKDFWEYNPATNLWTQKANFGGAARYTAVGFNIDGKGYIGTGYNPSLLKDFWEYNPATDTWTQQTDFAGSARQSSASVGFSIGSKGYVGTGHDGTSKKDFWEYDQSTNIWTQRADFGGAARYAAVGFSIGTKGYIGTGYNDQTSTRFQDFWEYETSSNSWTQVANFGGTARYGATAFVVGTKAYIGTGADASGYRNDFWEFSICTISITSLTQTNVNCFGGANGSATANVSSGFTPYTYAWTTSPAQTTQTATGLSAGTYTVTVTDSTSCSAFQSVTITQPPALVADAGADVDICSGQSTSFSATATGGTSPYSFLWSNGANTANTIVSPVSTTVFTVTITDNQGCTNADSIPVTVIPLPVADAGPDQTIFAGQSVQIGSAPVLGNTYSWSPTTALNNPSVSNPITNTTTTIIYVLTVTNTNGCSANDTLIISVTDSIPLGNAAAFALLSGGDITALEETYIIEGNVGAMASVSTDISSKDSIYSGNILNVQQALSDLSTAIGLANQAGGLIISNTLDGLVLNQGTYKINGDAVLNAVLSLSGDSNSIYIFNISGSLTFNHDVSVVFNNVLPQNVYWNVAQNVNINIGAWLNGIIMAGGKINLSLHVKGQLSLLAFDDIIVVNSCNLASANLLRQITLQSLIQNFDNDVIEPPPSTFASDCDRSSPDFNFYGNRDTWQLETNFNINTPIKTILVNFHIFQNSSGGNNFQNNSNDLNSLQNIFNWANDAYENIAKPTDPILSVCSTSICTACTSGDCWIPDTKIRFELNRIEFYRNDVLNLNDNVPGYISALVARDPEMLNQLNVYFTEGHYTNDPNSTVAGRSHFPGYNFSDNLETTMFRVYSNGVGGYWAKAGVIAHEWGHNLDLNHTYDGCSSGTWFDDIHGAPFPGNCPHNGCWSCNPSLPNDKFTNNTIGGNQSYGYFSPKQISKMHRALSLKTVRRYVKDCPYTTTPLVVINNENWDFDIKLYRDLIVESGATLTITCRVLFPEGAKLIVKPGARLILDGGTLSSGCSGGWQGIEVWGDIDQPQLTSDHSPQGVLIINNGAVVENAHEAVRLWKEGDYYSTGGVVQASNSTFRNNSRDVEFIAYHNYNPVNNPNTEIDNISIFDSCTFVTDASLQGNMNLRDHVTMWKTRGVKFRGNTFEFIPYKIQPGNEDVPLNKRGTGILSIDASYKVTPTCWIANNDGSCAGTPNRFIKLNKGIDVANATGSNKVTVYGNLFNDNLYGMVLNASSYTTVWKNTFNISREAQTISGVPSFYQHFGIYAASAYGYNIEQNTFNYLPSPNPGGISIGMLAQNSKTSGGAIYSNSFSGLTRANSMQQNNSNLAIDCNNYSANQYDWTLTSGSIKDPQGLCDQQDNTLPQANQFSSVNCGMVSKQIYKNAGAAGFTYNSYDVIRPNCYSNGVSVPVTCRSGNVPQDACPPTISGNTSEKKSHLTNISSQLAVLNSKIDGGNTQSLLNSIATKSDGQMKNTLMTASPYLSDVVLLSYTSTPTTGSKAVSPGNYKQVIIVNSPVTAQVKTAIDNRSLPSGIRQQINAAQVGVSERQILEGQIASLESEKQLLINAIVADYLDTGIADSAVLFLEQQNTLNSQLMLLQLVATSDTVKAKALIQSIRDSAAVVTNPQTTIELTTLANYNELAIRLTNRQGSYFNMSTQEEQAIRTIANSNMAVAVNAQAILSLVFNEEFERLAELLDENMNARMANMEEKTTRLEWKINLDENLFVKIYPNPANETFTVEYKLPDDSKEGNFILYDIMGKEVMRKILSANKNREQFSLSFLNSGLFYYNLLVSKNSIARDKLIVIKR